METGAASQHQVSWLISIIESKISNLWTAKRLDPIYDLRHMRMLTNKMRAHVYHIIKVAKAPNPFSFTDKDWLITGNMPWGLMWQFNACLANKDTCGITFPNWKLSWPTKLQSQDVKMQVVAHAVPTWQEVHLQQSCIFLNHICAELYNILKTYI